MREKLQRFIAFNLQQQQKKNNNEQYETPHQLCAQFVPASFETKIGDQN